VGYRMFRLLLGRGIMGSNPLPERRPVFWTPFWGGGLNFVGTLCYRKIGYRGSLSPASFDI
jgi:hypothetical protein